MEYALLIDKAVTLLMALMNVLGATQKVSDIIAKRIAEKRDWTPEEKAAVEADLDASDKRADAAITAAGG